MKKVKLRDVKTMIEYNGDMYTAEELQAEYGINGDFEIYVNDVDDTWFGRAMQTLRDKSGDQ
jgi:hypothetical protein